jgi:3,4-dihydroxy-2-butanone 4-phosphate synthase
VAGGTLERPGHTEAAIDLVRRAGLRPVAVICEIADREGRMVRGPRLRRFAARHGMPFLTIDDFILTLADEAGRF